MIVFKVILVMTFVAICTSLPFQPKDIETAVQNQLQIQSVLRNRIYSTSPDKRNGVCHVVGYKASCCQHVEVDAVDLNSTVCAAVTYLTKNYGILLTLTIDGKVIINQEISARNPPPVCADIPYLKKYASICLDFYNLTISNATFSGCTKVQIRLVKVIKGDFEIGCFSIPIPGESEKNLAEIKSKFIAFGTNRPIRKAESLREDMFYRFGIKSSETSWNKETSIIST